LIGPAHRERRRAHTGAARMAYGYTAGEEGTIVLTWQLVRVTVDPP
jgi:hypothetical protein